MVDHVPSIGLTDCKAKADTYHGTSQLPRYRFFDVRLRTRTQESIKTHLGVDHTVAVGSRLPGRRMDLAKVVRIGIYFVCVLLWLNAVSPGTSLTIHEELSKLVNEETNVVKLASARDFKRFVASEPPRSYDLFLLLVSLSPERLRSDARTNSRLDGL